MIKKIQKYIHLVLTVTLFCVFGQSGYVVAEITKTPDLSQNSSNNDIDEVILKTANGVCAMHYLTRRNVSGYVLETTGSCKTGWIDGYATVTIKDAFGRPVEQIYGFFKDGYWVGTQRIDAPVVGRFTPDKQIQAISFDLGYDEQKQVQFYGQARSFALTDGSYEAFNACDPVRILAVTPNQELFEDEKTQQDLLQTAIQKAGQICPMTTLIYFFGSEHDNPKKEDITFFADLDLTEKQIKVRRLPSSPRYPDLGERQALSSIPMPIVVKQEKGQTVMHVEPILPVNSKSETEINNPKGKQKSVERLQKEINIIEQKKSLKIDENMEMAIPEKEENSSLSETELNAEPDLEHQKNVIRDIVSKTDLLPVLLASSRVLKQPIKGRAIVRVNRILPNEIAEIDKPMKLEAKGKLPSPGWYIIEGSFSWVSPALARKSAYPVQGRVSIYDAIACDDDLCGMITKEF